jgi:hypothetical protein
VTDSYCPQGSGNLTAYAPQWREKDGDEWLYLPTKRVQDDCGAPSPPLWGGLFDFLGLYGYEQAMTLAWQAAAQARAQSKTIQTRVVTFEFTYELKARLLPGKEIDCNKVIHP